MTRRNRPTFDPVTMKQTFPTATRADWRRIFLGREIVQDKKGKSMVVTTYTMPPANPGLRPRTQNREAARYARRQG